MDKEILKATGRITRAILNLDFDTDIDDSPEVDVDGDLDIETDIDNDLDIENDLNVIDDSDNQQHNISFKSLDCRSECKYNSGSTSKYAKYGFAD